MNQERRGFGRFGTALKACYIIKSARAEDKHDCVITNMSRKGCGLQMKADHKIIQGADIRLEIDVPEKKCPTYLEGVVKWVENRGATWAAGVESLKIIDELEFSKRS